jgi:hypothetical protein
VASRACSEASSVVIDCIPLVTSGALLLHNKLVAFLRRNFQSGAGDGSRRTPAAAAGSALCVE